MSIPIISKDLIEYLASVFPGKLPSETQTDLAEINALIGEQRVIAFLKAEYQHQEEEYYV